jgi:hydroxymethylpyrimidine/phosphomethylpyrimidine kinase
MPLRKSIPIALTIAGSDSGGGAGIQADLKTFAALGVHGTSAITCVTAQNPRGLRAVGACRPELVRAQLAAVFAELPPAAVKTGMLFSRANIGAVADFFRGRGRPPLVVDPVMVATSGAALLQRAARNALRRQLLPLAALVTPNLPEAEALTGLQITDVEAMRRAARQLRRQLGCAVLLKGGHLPDSREAVDIFYDGRAELLLTAPFIRGVDTHGTGCAYSAAIVAYLALGCALPQAVARAKQYITQAIAHAARAGKHDVLGHVAAAAKR